MDVDETLLKLGKFNRRRIAVYCMVCCSVTIVGCWHMMASVFLGNRRIIVDICIISDIYDISGGPKSRLSHRIS